MKSINGMIKPNITAVYIFAKSYGTALKSNSDVSAFVLGL